ncbi:Protein MOS2 [Glycine soja]|uniref:Protein MOS2 n=1 Tax=Glycine soja TaxID=3848 RepID=A0A0B2PIA0_GLYSO|nr:Protein MOS2 [Glycine soja]
MFLFLFLIRERRTESMKLSFSVPSSKPHSKPKAVSNTFDDNSTSQNDTGGTKYLITEFDPSKPAPTSVPKTLIPPIQNQWQPFKKMKNLHLPTAADAEPLIFELHTNRDQPESDISYSLNLPFEEWREVKVKVGDVAELGSKEEKRCLRKLKELKARCKDKEEDKVSKSKRGRDEVEEKRGDLNRRKEKRVDVGRKEERRVVDHRKVSWLTSHIRVRVISRDLKGGRLYLKKGEVLDVVGPTTCDISMDENREIVQGVSQDVLETVIPKRGGPVLVLAGKYKGVYGSLAERDFDRETAIVRDADTHELLNVKLEQIAEYIGDPSLLGH